MVKRLCFSGVSQFSHYISKTETFALVAGRRKNWRSNHFIIEPQTCFSLNAVQQLKKLRTTCIFTSHRIVPDWDEFRMLKGRWDMKFHTGQQMREREQLSSPSLCTPSPWWLWWAVWLSVWWERRSERHTVPRDKPQSPRRSPETTRGQTHTKHEILNVWEQHWLSSHFIIEYTVYR